MKCLSCNRLVVLGGGGAPPPKFSIGDRVLYTPKFDNLSAYRPHDAGVVVGVEGDYVIMTTASGDDMKVKSYAVTFMPGSEKDLITRARARLREKIKQKADKRTARTVWEESTNVDGKNAAPDADVSAAYASHAKASLPTADLVASYAARAGGR